MAITAQAGTIAPVKRSKSFGEQPLALKIGVVILLIAALITAWYVFLFEPIREERAAAKKKNAQLVASHETARARNLEFTRVREALANRESLDRANRRTLPVEPEIASFLRDLNRLAESSGLRLQSVVRRAEIAGEVTKIPVSLLMKGRYHQLERFFYQVSRLERAVSMENIGIGSPEITGDDVVVSVMVLATTYARPENAVKKSGRRR